jgi:hypothetical protein
MKKILLLLGLLLLSPIIQAGCVIEGSNCLDCVCNIHNPNSNCSFVKGSGYASLSCPTNDSAAFYVLFIGNSDFHFVGSGSGYIQYGRYTGGCSNTASPFNYNFNGDYDKCLLLGTSGGSIIFYYTAASEGSIISTISGNRYCPSTTILYILNDGSYIEIDSSSVSTYNFTIMEDHEYLIVFDEYNFYYFTADGSDIVRNFNNCGSAGDPTDPVPEDDPYNPDPRDTYIRLYFYDNCNNLIRETAGTYYSASDPWEQAFYAPLGFIDIDYDDQAYLEMWVDSAIGTLYYNISNPKSADILTYIILNPTISWTNNILVRDGNTSLPIESALVTFSQDCIIDPLVYPPRHKFTDVNGIVNFDQCELDSFSLGVSANGYQSFFDSDISSTSLNAFQLEQTITIILYPLDDEENETIYNYTDYNTHIKFKDITGNYTATILDTDDYVDLYYFNNNSEGIGMTLKFQKYSVDTGIIDLLSWNIPIDIEGYKRIFKTNYTDVSYLYIGYLYNYTIDGWDKTKYLTVRNETDEIVLNYENLSTNLWFRYKNIEGNIDYREDINIYAYANTSYVGLFDISLELYDNAVYVEHINLTWADFVNADFFFYEWDPDYSYINGHNYTVRMHGYDYYLLDLDYINASDYRKNKLTILVKNQYGTDLTNCFIYLEDYGSLSTNTNNYNSYENLDNGYYRYRATKPNYVATGWSDITLSDSDEIVTYVLTSTDSDAGSATQPQKMSDSDLSNIYLILMAIILIFIILGGFIYATK